MNECFFEIKNYNFLIQVLKVFGKFSAVFLPPRTGAAYCMYSTPWEVSHNAILADIRIQIIGVKQRKQAYNIMQIILQSFD